MRRLTSKRQSHQECVFHQRDHYFWIDSALSFDPFKSDGGVAEPTEVGRIALVEVSRPNATLVEGDVEAVVRGLKAQLVGEIEVAGPDLARSLTDLGSD
jgi:hypothetical protein